MTRQLFLLNCRAASDLIEELLDSKRYNSRARPQADSSKLSIVLLTVCLRSM